ncbi:MAG: PspC domain-containing protein [Bacteroidaceae bacterium]|nr:PspC domain-containing protein [Bacteroidaceae bacterium]
MKKNITINLYGNLYAIDEDAYELLNNYLENMKRHFAQKEDGEEIANDIECRIAELMQELKESGVEAVNIDHVKEIVARVGNPEEVDEEKAEPTTDHQPYGHKGAAWFDKKVRDFKNNLRGKSLYRNPDNMVLGGVLSGLAQYLGVDVTLLRLLTVLLTLVYGTGLFIYLICWIVIPVANKPEDRLKMRGEEVNLENLTEEMIKEPESNTREGKVKHEQYGCSNFLFRGVVMLMKWTLVCLLSLIALTGCGLLIAGLVIAAMTLFEGDPIVNSSLNSTFTTLTGHSSFWMILGVVVISSVSAIWAASYLIVRLISANKEGKEKNMLFAAIAMLVSMAVCIAGIAAMGMQFGEISKTERKLNQQTRKQKDIDEQLAWLEEQGWNVLKHEHIREDRYVRRGSHYSGDRNKRYIDATSEHPDMDYTLERTVKLSPGIYRLKAVGRTNGSGPGIYIINNGRRYEVAIPNYGNKGGEIWENAQKELATAVKGSPQQQEWEKQAAANKGKGFGWSRVVIDNIAVTDSILRYGVSNRCMSNTIWNGTYICATDFKLERVK